MSAAKVRQMPAGPELELFNRFRAELAEMLADRELVTFVVSAAQAWGVFANLQLALRHPQNNGPIAEWARQVALELQEIVAPPGTARRQLADRGWKGE
jgi:hypothetical protein